MGCCACGLAGGLYWHADDCTNKATEGKLGVPTFWQADDWEQFQD